MTAAEAASSEGQELIAKILAICHDGRITIQEVEDLHAWMGRVNATMNAIPFLRSITRDVISDDAVSPEEEYRLKRAFERVVIKEARGVVSTHLEGLGLPPSRSDEDSPPRWHSDPVTTKQIEYISILGGTPAIGMTKGEASILIDELLSNRKPTPRQKMLLRFFDRLDLIDLPKEDVSEWIDEFFSREPRMEAIWDIYKRETGHDPHSQDFEAVPIGAFKHYLRREATSQSRVGCLTAVALAGIAVALL
jgi:hypothetical protein